MTAGRERLAASSPAGPSRTSAAQAAQRSPADRNAATRATLARKPSPQRTFRVVIVDDGASGLGAKTIELAVGHVRAELDKLTSASTNALVKAGIEVEVRRTAPERGTDFGRRDLDVTTWIVFLIRRGDAKKAVGLGYHYLDLDERDRAAHEKTTAAGLAKEGGHNLQTYSRKRGHPSESISFVGTDEPLRLEKAPTFGPASAGREMAEVILHELGHAMGHVHYDDDEASKDHDTGGIMAPAVPIGSSGPYAPASFSTASAAVIRARLEWLAGRIAARTPA
jgi:hypothetical protein